MGEIILRETYKRPCSSRVQHLEDALGRSSRANNDSSQREQEHLPLSTRRAKC